MRYAALASGLLAISVMGASPASAQSLLNAFGQQDDVPQPSNEPPPLPPQAVFQKEHQTIMAPPQPAGQQAKTPAVTEEIFPELPPAKPCTQGEITGVVWKLANVYQLPAGDALKAFADSPSQYLQFGRGNLYRTLNAGKKDLDAMEARGEMDAADPNLYQYLLQDTGMLFFYINGQAMDTEVCFLVTNPRGDFKIGQMLLIPPQGQIRGRQAKVYNIIRPEDRPHKKGQGPQ